MKLSVITPCFNYGKFLPDAVASVRSQISNDLTRDDLSIEHIVIDGGSSDGSVEWLQKYVASKQSSERYVFSFISEPDKGQTDAINKGLRMATGDIVCWLNADEYYQAGALGKIAREFNEQPAADVIYGEPVFADSEGVIIKHKKEHRFDRNILLYYGCYITSCCTFWRRKVLDAGHYLDDSYKATMDFEYYVRLVDLGYSFHFIPETIASFIWHDSNVSNVFADVRRKERLQVQRKYGMRVLFLKETPEWLLDGLAKLFRLKRFIMTLPRRLSCK